MSFLSGLARMLCSVCMHGYTVEGYTLCLVTCCCVHPCVNRQVDVCRKDEGSQYEGRTCIIMLQRFE